MGTLNLYSKKTLSFLLSFCHSSKIFPTALYNSVRRVSARRNACLWKFQNSKINLVEQLFFLKLFNLVKMADSWKKQYRIAQKEKNGIFGCNFFKVRFSELFICPFFDPLRIWNSFWVNSWCNPKKCVSWHGITHNGHNDNFQFYIWFGIDLS